METENTTTRLRQGIRGFIRKTNETKFMTPFVAIEIIRRDPRTKEIKTKAATL